PDEVPQVTTPILQTPPGLLAQTVPTAQLVQAPPLQALSTPHAVPSGTAASSRHCGAPVVQSIAPTLQGAFELVWHRAPWAHAMHVPAALQTCPVPQLAPGDLMVPFVQLTGLQVVTPFAHGSLLVVHVMPAAQAVHAPPMQILLAPQSVPS